MVATFLAGLAVLAALALLILYGAGNIEDRDEAKRREAVREIEEVISATRSSEGSRLIGLLNEALSTRRDPWGNAYVVAEHNGSVRLLSYGRDGQPGGTAEDADIIREIR